MLNQDMSGFISTLLAKEKTAIRSTLNKLETASGERSIDNRLTSEIIVKSKLKIRQLGLDSDDSTAAEVHNALINLVGLHDKFLAKAIGAQDSSDVADILPKLTKYAEKIAKTKKVWAIKHSVAKRQIKNLPPKVLMKKLGYRSIDSMLKRETVEDLFAGLRITESDDYLSKFYGNFKKLTPSDFETRKLSVRLLTQKKWDKVSAEYVKQSKNNIIGLRELGSVVTFSLPIKSLKGVSIMLLPLILHKLNEIHLYSSYFKFEQVQHDFGEIFSNSILSKPNTDVTMAGISIDWKIIRDHFGKLAVKGLTDVFEPHIQSEDLSSDKVEESLYKLEPALHFWFGNDCLGVPYPHGLVSFNLMDIATDYVNNLKFGDNSTSYLSESLWDEMLERYLKEEPLHDQVLQQLDKQLEYDEFSEEKVSGAIFA